MGLFVTDTHASRMGSCPMTTGLLIVSQSQSWTWRTHGIANPVESSNFGCALTVATLSAPDGRLLAANFGIFLLLILVSDRAVAADSSGLWAAAPTTAFAVSAADCAGGGEDI